VLYYNFDSVKVRYIYINTTFEPRNVKKETPITSDRDARRAALQEKLPTLQGACYRLLMFAKFIDLSAAPHPFISFVDYNILNYYIAFIGCILPEETSRSGGMVFPNHIHILSYPYKLATLQQGMIFRNFIFCSIILSTPS